MGRGACLKNAAFRSNNSAQVPGNEWPPNFSCGNAVELPHGLELSRIARDNTEARRCYWGCITMDYMAVCQNLVPLVNIKIAGKWMFISLKMVLIGIDP